MDSYWIKPELDELDYPIVSEYVPKLATMQVEIKKTEQTQIDISVFAVGARYKNMFTGQRVTITRIHKHYEDGTVLVDYKKDNPVVLVDSKTGESELEYKCTKRKDIFLKIHKPI